MWQRLYSSEDHGVVRPHIKFIGKLCILLKYIYNKFCFSYKQITLHFAFGINFCSEILTIPSIIPIQLLNSVLITHFIIWIQLTEIFKVDFSLHLIIRRNQNNLMISEFIIGHFNISVKVHISVTTLNDSFSSFSLHFYIFWKFWPVIKRNNFANIFFWGNGWQIIWTRT